MALIGPVEWYRGDSYPFELTVKDKETGNPIDITGYSFLFTVNTSKDPIDAADEVFSVSGVLDGTPSTGKVSFTPTAVQTNIDKKKYYYDVQMTDDSGNIRTIAKNSFSILQDITK